MVSCTFCKEANVEDSESCVKCGYPFHASSEVKSKFVAVQLLKRSRIQQSEDDLNRARKILWFLSAVYGLQTLMAIVNPLLPVINLYSFGVLTILFVACSFLVKTKPKLALSIPFSLLLLSYLVQIAVLPRMSVFQIAFPLILMSILGYAFFSVHKSDQIRRENAYLANS
jgi:hypothetical protein